MPAAAAPSEDLVDINRGYLLAEIILIRNSNRNLDSESAADLFRVRLHNRPL
jgi:hypothetical protein